MNTHISRTYSWVMMFIAFTFSKRCVNPKKNPYDCKDAHILSSISWWQKVKIRSSWLSNAGQEHVTWCDQCHWPTHTRTQHHTLHNRYKNSCHQRATSKYTSPLRRRGLTSCLKLILILQNHNKSHAFQPTGACLLNKRSHSHSLSYHLHDSCTMI